MPKQGLEVLPIAGYDVVIHFKSGETITLSRAQIKHDNGTIHVGLIEQSSLKSYPFIKSTTEFKAEEIRRITYRPFPEEPALTLYPHA